MQDALIGVGARDHVAFKRIEIRPDADVNDDPVAVIRALLGGVVGSARQTPDKPSTLLRQRVDRLKRVHELFHLSALKRVAAMVNCAS